VVPVGTEVDAPCSGRMTWLVEPLPQSAVKELSWYLRTQAEECLRLARKVQSPELVLVAADLHERAKRLESSIGAISKAAA
jgi:hypothetical protein